MKIKIPKIFRSLRDIEKSCREITERLEEKLKNILSQDSCISSKVPEGRVWCDYFNQTFAGRCRFSCIGYENKYLTNKS